MGIYTGSVPCGVEETKGTRLVFSLRKFADKLGNKSNTVSGKHLLVIQREFE